MRKLRFANSVNYNAKAKSTLACGRRAFAILENITQIHSMGLEDTPKPVGTSEGVKEIEVITKTLTIGNIGSTEKAFEIIEAAGKTVAEPYVQAMVKNIKFSSEPEEMVTVGVTLENLGLDYTATVTQIIDRARTEGWEVCPGEVGVTHFLEREEGDEREYIIATDPVSDKGFHADTEEERFSYMLRHSSGNLGAQMVTDGESEIHEETVLVFQKKLADLAS